MSDYYPNDKFSRDHKLYIKKKSFSHYMKSLYVLTLSNIHVNFKIKLIDICEKREKKIHRTESYKNLTRVYFLSLI